MIAAHSVDAASGWGGRRADEDAWVWGGVGVEARDGAGEYLADVGCASGDGTAHVVGVVAFEVGGSGYMSRQDLVSEARRESFNLLLDTV